MQEIYSTALYCERECKGHISEEWLDEVLHFLQAHGLCICEYAVSETSVCAEGSYTFREEGPQLLAAVRSSELRDLFLYCHPEERQNLVFDWDGAAAIRLSSGYMHVGLPKSSGITLSELLRQSYFMAKPLAPWRYGIGYSRSSSKAPGMYAVGMIGGDYPDMNREQLDRIGCWATELRGARRHLADCLRDVYPANLLTAEHVNARIGEGHTLLSAGWGEFTQIDDVMWLWVVPDEDIVGVRSALIEADLVICP